MAEDIIIQDRFDSSKPVCPILYTFIRPNGFGYKFDLEKHLVGDIFRIGKNFPIHGLTYNRSGWSEKA